MNKKEFDVWRTRHCAIFPGLMAFVSKTFGNDESLAAAFWDEWFQVLKSESLEDALAASRKLASSEETVAYERHPWAIKNIIRGLKLARYDWDAVNQSYCEICHGTGAVVIRRNDGYQAAVACTCKLGTAMKAAFPKIAIFDEKVHTRAM